MVVERIGDLIKQLERIAQALELIAEYQKRQLPTKWTGGPR